MVAAMYSHHRGAGDVETGDDQDAAFLRSVDDHIATSSLAISLRKDGSWRESRSYADMAPDIRRHSLTAMVLSGKDMIAVPPYLFHSGDESELVQVMYIGPNVCGHPGMAHGGFLATILDEGLARCAFPALEKQVGVTASLQVNYRQPTSTEQFLVLRARKTKVEGKRVWVEGWLESLSTAEEESPPKLVEASGLFIEINSGPP